MYIAIDAAGGDFAPRNIVDGALVAARHGGFGLTLVGNRPVIEAELARHGDAARVDVRFVDAVDVVGGAEPPAAVIRRKPRSSVRQAAEVVARGDAAAFFSAGNTGAALLAAHAAFGLLSGVERPALATAIPTRRGSAILLDAGANVECRPRHLVQFAAMGCVYARLSLGVSRPRVGLLSIGEEATKGNELTRDAHRRLQDSGLDFIGNIEARDVFTGQADVIVCDGFTGNVALKVSEGLVEMVEALLREELGRTFTTRVGYLFSSRALRRFRRRVDYSRSGGRRCSGWPGCVSSATGARPSRPCATRSCWRIASPGRASSSAWRWRLPRCPARPGRGGRRGRAIDCVCISRAGIAVRRHGEGSGRDLPDLPGYVRAG